jgi:hypothetical protein
MGHVLASDLEGCTFPSDPRGSPADILSGDPPGRVDSPLGNLSLWWMELGGNWSVLFWVVAVPVRRRLVLYENEDPQQCRLSRSRAGQWTATRYH